MSNLYNFNETYQCPFGASQGYMYDACKICPYCANTPMNAPDYSRQYADEFVPFSNGIGYASTFDFTRSPEDDVRIVLKDYGPKPFVVNIDEATKQNKNYRTTLWTGKHLQTTLMSLKVGEDIGLEMHPNVDQFIRVEQGQGIARMGARKDRLDFEQRVGDGFAIFVPAGTWHNLINTGNVPLKVYSIYAPPQHPHGTVHVTKAAAHAGSERDDD